jgi:hypothetical protein
MRQQIRSHLTYANVISTLALFLVLGGGTALGAYVISSNSQVGPGTISGHKPPTGDHANIIGGSVNATDLAASAVTTGKLSTGAVASPKLANGAVTATKLGSDSVNSAKIVNGSVGSADLAGEAPNDAGLALDTCDAGSDYWDVPGFGVGPHYWLDAEGIVHLDGAVSCPGTATNGTSIFHMPGKYQPAQQVVRFGVLGGSQSLAQVAVIRASNTAAVVYDAGTNGSITDDYVSLDGITYRAITP